MRYLSILSALLALAACQTPKRGKVPTPSVAPIQQALTETRAAIDAAGGANTKLGEHVKTAIEMADELAALFDKIEREQTKTIR